MQELEIMAADYSLMKNPLIVQSLNTFRDITSKSSGSISDLNVGAGEGISATAATEAAIGDTLSGLGSDNADAKEEGDVQKDQLVNKAAAVRMRREEEKAHKAHLKELKDAELKEAKEKEMEEEAQAAERKRLAKEAKDKGEEEKRSLEEEKRDLKRMEEEAASSKNTNNNKPVPEPYNKQSSDDEAFLCKRFCTCMAVCVLCVLCYHYTRCVLSCVRV